MADGLTSACAECHKQQQREYIARRSQKKTFDRVREEKPKVKVSPKIDVPAGYKACTKCEQVFPATSEYFHRDVSKADGCSSKCRQCRSNHVRQKRHENIEETREYSRSYYATHREQVKANVRASTVRHQEKRNAYENAYWQEHKEQKKAKVHRRKARQRNLPDNFTGADWQYCLDYWDHRCAVCGRTEGEGFVLAPDHWIAVMDKRPDNPGTVPTNIVPLCHSDKGSRGGCNNSKHNRDAVKWLVERHGQAQAAEIIRRVEAYFADIRAREGLSG